MAYTTLAEVKERLGLADTGDDANIQAAIDAAERLIDGWCRRTFRQSVSQTRRFTAVTPVAVEIDDAVSIASVAVDRDGDGAAEETVPTSAYDVWPYGAAAASRPYTRLLIRPAAGLLLPSASGTVHVTAVWGWPAVPAPVKLAAEIQATVLFRQATQAPWGVSDESLAGTDITMRSRFLDRQVLLLLSPYRRVMLR